MDSIRKLTPQQRFEYWVIERQSINVLKKVQPFPWTDDEILQNYHFTNVKREDDKVSKWLIDNIYNGITVHPWAVILICRFVNKIESLEPIAQLLKDGKFITAKQKLQEMSEHKKIFGAAYLQPEIPGVNRLDKIFDVLVPQIIEVQPTTDSLEGAVNDICSIKYLGEFIGGQIAMDALIFLEGEWVDRWTYAPEGPGSLRGIQRLKEEPLTHKVNREEYNQWLTKLAHSLGVRALDIEHSLCEWDKYERLLWNEKPYKRNYSPPNETNSLFDV